MVKSHLSLKLTLVFFISLSLFACNVSTDSEVEITEETEIETDSTEEETPLPEEIHTPYEVISGDEFFAQNQISVLISNTDQKIDIECTIDLDTLAEYPKAIKSNFGEHETADRLQLTLVGKDSTGKKLFTLQEEAFTGGPRDFNFSVPVNEYKSLKTGLQKINLNFEVEYVTFRSDESGVKPIQTEVQIMHHMPPVYETIFYFKSLKLNKEKVTVMLGKNDHSNSDPETGLRVLWNDTQYLYEHTENSFQLNKKVSAKIYHTNPSDFITIRILDVDYGFNISDVIEEIPMSLEHLQTETYQNYPSEYVDELWIYAKHVGQVN